MKKKICFITTTPATLRAFVIETAKHLYFRSGYDITFLSSKDDSFASSLPNYIHYLPVNMKRGVTFDFITPIFQMFRIFIENRFDLVQYSTPNASVYASIASKLAGIKSRLYCQWGIRYVGMNGYRRRVFKLLEKIPCFLSTDIRSVSRNNLDFAVQEKLYPESKSCVLGQGGTIGVDLSDFNIENRECYREEIRVRHNIDKEFVFGFVGRLSRDKGANEMLQAFRRLTRNVPAKLMCVGGVESGVDESMQKWAKNSRDVIFTGEVKYAEIKKYFSTFDCYLHPSYREGFGMVIQEAGAMGCPIITTNIPGASEVMEDGISCLLVKAKDPVSLENKMETIMNDNNLRKSLGENARKRVELYFDRRIMLETLKKDYEALLNKGA